MATTADVRRIALSFPDTTEDPDFTFRVGGRHFVWRWRERVDPKRPRVPNPDVIAVSVANDVDKSVLLAMDPDVFFTEPHYDGYNAVLVRVPKIDGTRLRQVIAEAHACRMGSAGRATRSGSPAPRRRPAGAARRARPARPRRA